MLASQIDTLRGLKGVGIGIRNIPSQFEKDGLTKDQIQLDVESKLRMAGIEVLFQKEWREEEGNPHLFVSLIIEDMKDMVKEL